MGFFGGYFCVEILILFRNFVLFLEVEHRSNYLDLATSDIKYL